MKSIITVFIVITFLYSCSPLGYFKDRREKDQLIANNNYKKLEGEYSNYSIESNEQIGYHLSKVYRENDSIFRFVQLHTLDNKTIQLDFFHTDTAISSLVLKGKYKNGYFIVKPKFPVHFIAGPLLWVGGSSINYIGLTKSDNLVLLNSSVGDIFITIIPMPFIADGQSASEFKREIK